MNEEGQFVQEDVINVDEKMNDGKFLSPKQDVRRTVSDDDRLQHHHHHQQQQQQQQQLPVLTTQHLSQAKTDLTMLLSPVSRIIHCNTIRSEIRSNADVD